MMKTFTIAYQDKNTKQLVVHTGEFKDAEAVHEFCLSGELPIDFDVATSVQENIDG